MTTLNEVRLIDLPRVAGDRKGSLTFIYEREHMPFQIARVYYLYDVPGGAERAGHAHYDLQQLLIAVSGSFDVFLDDGQERCRVSLSRPYFGLYIPRMIWRELVNFSSGSVCLTLASLPYDREDYISDYGLFLKIRKKQKDSFVKR